MRFLPLSVAGLLLSCALVAPVHAASALVTSTGVAASNTQTTCPPNPTAGSTINGTLLVNGLCVLDSVTVTGSVKIAPGGLLFATHSTIRGSLSDIGGGIALAGDTVFGAITIDLTNSTGPGVVNLCASQFRGAVSVKGAPRTFIGDTGKDFSCSVNGISGPNQFIGGSLTVTDSPNSFIGGNTSGGALTVLRSQGTKVEDNTIGGSATCDSTTTGLGNTARGTNTCNTKAP